jgi:hypothetical protein
MARERSSFGAVVVSPTRAGSLSAAKVQKLDDALRFALGLE